MKKFDELLTKLKGLKIIQTAGEWDENIPIDIWDQHFDENHKELKGGLDIQTHRWYETSIIVIEIYEGLLGIRCASNMFSENQEWEDCCVRIEFMEMKEVSIISYEEINGRDT